MAAVWMRTRAELRGRWRSLLAVAILVGLAGGATLAAVAGARRTDSAFDRLVRDTEAWDVLVNPDFGGESALDPDDVAALPQVARAGRIDGLYLAPGRAESLDDLGAIGLTAALGGDVGDDFGRLRLSEGRAPRRDRPHEMVIDPLLADQTGWGVGDRIPLLTLRERDLRLLAPVETDPDAVRDLFRSGVVGDRFTATVTGIGVTPEQIVVDEGFALPRLLLSAAFREAHPEASVAFWGALVRLRHGSADLPAFRRSVEALVPEEPIAFQSLERTLEKADRAVRPSVGALTIFAAVVALTGLLVVGQALARQTALDSLDDDALRALGMTQRGLFAAAMVKATLVAVGGGGLAVVVAAVASPLTPIGVARDAEPEPGFSVDLAVLGVGFVVAVALVLLLAAIPAWRSTRARTADDRGERPSRVAAVAAGAGLPVTTTAGVRLALERGRGRTAVPVRITMLSAAVAVATLTAAGVFATSLDHLVSTPRLFGWNWDVLVSVNAEDAREGADGRIEFVPVPGIRDAAVAVLDGAPAVERWSTVSLGDLVLDERPVPAVGISNGGDVAPTLVAGALPDLPDEVALGALTQRGLGVGIGETVTATTPAGDGVRLTVVGTVVLPGLGTYDGADKTALGEGAVVTRDALYRLGPDFGRDDFAIRFATEASADARDGVLGEIAAVTDEYVDGFDVQTLQRPADIVAYDRVRSTPVMLAAVLGALGTASVAHALVSAVRRRRRDLAMLATLGLTRRQVSATVAWQATTFGVVALALGIPLGIVAGRWSWGLLADDVGTISEPRIPLLALVIGVPVVLVLCNAVAYVPGRMAARLRPAVVLRSE